MNVTGNTGSGSGVGYGFNNGGIMDTSLSGGTMTVTDRTGTGTGYGYGFYNNGGTMTTTLSAGSMTVTGPQAYGFINATGNGTLMPTTITGGTFSVNGATAALGTTLNFQGGTFASSVNGATFGGINPGTPTPLSANLTLSSRTIHQETISTTSIPVSMITPVGASGTSTATLGGTLNIITSYIPSIENQLIPLITTDTNSVITGQYASTTSSQSIPYTLVYSPSGVAGEYTAVSAQIGSFGSLGSTAGVAPGNNVAMGHYLTSLAPSATGLLAQAINDCYLASLSGNTVALNYDLNILSPALSTVKSDININNMTAATQALNQQLQSIGFTGSFSSAGFANQASIVNIDPKRLATFRSLLVNPALNSSNTANLVQPSGIPQRKGVLSIQFTNSPEEINRHQPQGGRIQVGKANVWVQPYGQLVHQKSNKNGPGVNSQLAGILLGADYEVAKNTIVGVLGGTSTSPFTWSQNRGSGTMNSGYGGLYAGWKEGDAGFYFNGQTIFGGNQFNTKRNITLTSITQVASGSHAAFQFTGNLEVGYAAPVYDWFVAQPFLLADYMVMRESGYTESGAGTLNMTLRPRTSQFLQAEVGATLYKTFAVGETLLRPTVELGFVQRRPLGNMTLSGGYVGQPSTLVVAGVNQTYNQIAPALGLIAQFKNGMYVSGNVYGAFGGGLNIGEALVRVGYEF